jgi:two-component system, NtrC family, response regulator AtoC
VVKERTSTLDDAATEGLTPDDGALSLQIVQGEVAEVFALDREGEYVVGRGRSADIRVDDPSLSRSHAILRVGATVTIQDCGSANGTTIGDERLAPGAQVELRAGMVLALGNVRGFVQRGAVTRRPRRIWARIQFERRIREECARPGAAPFTFAEVQVSGPIDARAVEKTLLGAARADDIIAQHAVDHYTLRMAGLDPRDARRVLVDPFESLTRAGARVCAGFAHFPSEAQTYEGLLAKASADIAASSARARATFPQGSEMERLRELVDRVAVGTIPVLVVGETGVGKEVLAKNLHTRSPRASKPFVRLNCAGFSEALLASELFGHEKGSFTGAHQTKIGLLEAAEGGTVFLDELGELPLSMQAKLLRVFEERAIMRVGGLSLRPIDVRFVAATNRDLEAEVAAGRFRRDLFFRLNGVMIRVRPLRERLAELDALASTFLDEAARAAGRPHAPILSREAQDAMHRHHWPGNVRELRNAMERAVLLCAGEVLLPEHLPLEHVTGRPSRPSAPPPPASPPPAAVAPSASTPSSPAAPPIPLREQIATIERERMLEALTRCGGNQTRAAKMLGISRGTLIARLASFDIPRPRKRPPRE